MVHASMLENIAWSGHSCNQNTLIDNTSQTLYQTWHRLNNWNTNWKQNWNELIWMPESLKVNLIQCIRFIGFFFVLAQYMDMLHEIETLKTKSNIEFVWFGWNFSKKMQFTHSSKALTYDLIIITIQYKSKFLAILVWIVSNAKEYITLFFR